MKQFYSCQGFPFLSCPEQSHTTADLGKHSSPLGVSPHERKSLLPRTSAKWTFKLCLPNIGHTKWWKSNWRAGPPAYTSPSTGTPRDSWLSHCTPPWAPPAMLSTINAALSALHKTQYADPGNRKIKVRFSLALNAFLLLAAHKSVVQFLAPVLC